MTPQETRDKLARELAAAFRDANNHLDRQDGEDLADTALDYLLGTGPHLIADGKIYSADEAESYDIDDDGWKWRVTLPWGSWEEEK